MNRWLNLISDYALNIALAVILLIAYSANLTFQVR